MIYTDFEMEQRLLGGLIVNYGAMLDMKLSPDDFAFSQHQEIYARMQEKFSEIQRFDPTDFTGIAGKYPDDMDSVGYLRLLGEYTLSAQTIFLQDYAEKLKELARKRLVLDQIRRAEIDLETSSSQSVVAQLHGNLSEGLDTRSIKTSEEIHAEIIKSLDLPKECHPTGLAPLDMAMNGGLYQGFTYGFAGAEKSGKTTLAHTISYNLGNSGCKHLYVALEMGSLQIEQRNLSRSAGINSLEFIRPSPESRNRIETTRATKNILYLDAPGATVEEIIHEAGIAAMKHGIKGFIVDYWQLVEGKFSRDTEERHMRMVAQTIANYARKKGLWCILLAQMNKDGDLFGGGGLRKACDQLYFIEMMEHHPDFRWLRMGASRYTPKVDVGSNEDPSLVLDKRVGPFFKEARIKSWPQK